ncbi:Calcipressin [Laetiporus sulphureus 93-53]|uniref:Calcipressin n=1 Tax=Laetiporus sulphureus 93-53 TaxID=1314785 RepID=A0A165H286_9APHY|nr:Calcipressin [Laetiporus sulphureus 93-53]KZT11144.1 Calcipressin [Laetiporus sulphureus 93-53]
MTFEHTSPAPSSPLAGTPPSLTSNSGTATPQRTNTLVIAQLPPTFFEAIVLDTLRRHFGTYGSIYAWAPLKSFARIILVYYSEDDAEQAKDACDRLLVGPSEDSPAALLRVYRADRTTIVVNEAEYDNIHLRPPKLEKNFLISPPGSPPVGWEPILEHPPNATPLAEDLMTALRHLQLQEEHRDRPPGVEVLLEPEDGVGISVYVEDCDGGEGGASAVEEDWNYGETSPARAQWRPMPTSMPPTMHVGA